MAEPKNDIDDWLDDLEDAGAPKSDELGQADIDQLLGGGGEAAPQAAPADTQPAGELDQSEIDRLLGGDSQVEDAAGGQVAQADIEALLGVGSDDAAPTSGVGAELNDTDIDSLLSGDGAPTQLASALPADDEVAKLFAGSEEKREEGEGTLAARAVDFAEILADDETAHAQPTALGDFFATPPPDAAGAQAEEETLLDDNLDTFLAEAPEPGTTAAAAPEKKRAPAARPKLSLSRGKLIALGLAACLAVTMAGGGYWLYKGPGKKILASLKKPPAPPAAVVGEPPAGQPAESAPAPPPPPPAPRPNTPPVVLGESYQMPPGGGEVAIRLAGRDDDGDALRYEVTAPPRFGRLSGAPPNLVFLPNTDFPGEDRFEYRASDGKDWSPPGVITVNGPPAAPPPAPVAAAKPPPEPEIRKAAKPAPVRKKAPPKKVVRKSPPAVYLAAVPSFRKVGERVVLDASGSVDDDRSSLEFAWEQVSGVPVQLTALNREGSVVSFIMPAAFSVEKDPAVTLRVTLTDKTGLHAARDIRIGTEARRSSGSALWGRGR